jgi:AcrR family transcriptional regulator
MTQKRQTKTDAKIKAALAKLLTEKSFDTISTKELADQAGISRSTFYTKYSDKYELIDNYQADLFETLEEIFTQHDTDSYAAMLEIFQLLAREEMLAALLSENGTKEIQLFLVNKFKILLRTVVHPQIGKRYYNQTDTDYVIEYAATAVFGYVQMWIRRGKTETPEHMAGLLRDILSSALVIQR